MVFTFPTPLNLQKKNEQITNAVQHIT